jgi:hypothetical protein
LNKWKNYLSQQLNVHRVSEVRWIEIHTVEPLVPGPCLFEAEIVTANLKKYKSPDCYQILAELVQAGGENIMV